MKIDFLTPVADLDMDLTPAELEKRERDLERNNVIVNINDILQLFITLRQKYHLNATDLITVGIMIDSLTKLHDDLLKGIISNSNFEEVRVITRNAYTLFPRISANYSQKEYKAYQLASDKWVSLTHVCIGILLAAGIAWLFN